MKQRQPLNQLFNRIKPMKPKWELDVCDFLGLYTYAYCSTSTNRPEEQGMTRRDLNALVDRQFDTH